MVKSEPKRSFRIGWRAHDGLLHCYYPQKFETVTLAEQFLSTKNTLTAMNVMICTPMGTPVEIWKPGKPYTAWM